MIVMRKSPFSGTVNQMDLDITVEQINLYQSKRVLIQDAFPQLSNEEREFYKTGITPAEWDAAFKEEGDD